MNNKENSRKIIHFLAGGYLSYLAFQLYSDVFNEITDPTFRVVFFIFATIFLVAGFLLMFFVLRSEIRKIKEKRAEEAQAALEEHTETETETEITDSEE
ncbi:MAG: hypothetical protein IJC58_07595 [Oscillospiraceae bacterium]|nr:hypothetical protein [Oscillospiraceae bacterium]